MIRIFKRRRPEPEPPIQISTADRLIAAHWGYTPEQWAVLPAMVRQDKRESLVWADGFRP
jgi:hypothetical protein